MRQWAAARPAMPPPIIIVSWWGCECMGGREGYLGLGNKIMGLVKLAKRK